MAKLDADDRNDLSKGNFAFPDQRKEPLEDASHVRNAVARFDQVQGVSDDEPTPPGSASSRLPEFGVGVKEKSWRELPKRKGS